MVGINVPIPVPMAFHSFGGWKSSLFGNHHMHGPESIRFYTRLKAITSRWPTGIRSGADFVTPTMKSLQDTLSLIPGFVPGIAYRPAKYFSERCNWLCVKPRPIRTSMLSSRMSPCSGRISGD